METNERRDEAQNDLNYGQSDPMLKSEKGSTLPRNELDEPRNREITQAEHFVMDVRNVRNGIDTLINTAKALDPSKEVSLCHTHLQRGKMWLGKTLGAVGTENPYKNSSNPENKIIDPQAEHSNATMDFPVSYSHIEKVKALRSELTNPISEVDKMMERPVPVPGKAAMYLKQSFLALEEAKMWLGWELDRLR